MRREKAGRWEIGEGDDVGEEEDTRKKDVEVEKQWRERGRRRGKREREREWWGQNEKGGER